jgi:hypothetical protein
MSDSSLVIFAFASCAVYYASSGKILIRPAVPYPDKPYLEDFFTTLSPIKSSFTPLENADRAEHVHINNVSSALLAGMSSTSEGDGGTPSSVLLKIGSPGKTSEPIGSLGSLAEYQLATPSFRGVRPQEWEEWQKATRYLASLKKRKVERAEITSISEDGLVHLVEDTITRILRGFVAPTPAAGTGEDVQHLRIEVEAKITKVRIELTQLVNTMIERL